MNRADAFNELCDFIERIDDGTMPATYMMLKVIHKARQLRKRIELEEAVERFRTGADEDDGK